MILLQLLKKGKDGFINRAYQCAGRAGDFSGVCLPRLHDLPGVAAPPVLPYPLTAITQVIGGLIVASPYSDVSTPCSQFLLRASSGYDRLSEGEGNGESTTLRLSFPMVRQSTLL